MKVLHINTYNTGGAAKAALRLHQGLLNEGIDSDFIVLYKTKNNIDRVYDYRDCLHFFKKKWLTLKNKLLLLKQKKQLSKYPDPEELFSFPNSVWDITLHPKFKEADIIHLHWISGFVDYATFFDKCDKPIFWTFHDFEPFSGGFHYSNLFEKKGYNKLLDTTLKLKHQILCNKKITVITPSKYLYDQAQFSFEKEAFKSSTKHIIPNGIVSNEVDFIDKLTARDKLRLPKDKKILLFLSEYLLYKRKGLSYVLEAFNKLKSSDTLLCLVGGLQGGDIPKNENIIHFEATTDDSRVNLFYSAADLYLNPSIDDISSNTLMEAQCAGCPVIAFDTGGISELANKSEFSFITKENNADSLFTEINNHLYKDFDRKKISERANEVYNIKTSSKAVIELYKKQLPS